MNSFISSLYVLLDVIKAFGPVLASGFLGWVAYNQFKLAKSQSKISQEQLALAKQQADIAQRKVELDIRDKKYDIFRRWNEAYCHLVTLSKVGVDLQEYQNTLLLFSAISNELNCIFVTNKDFHDYKTNIMDGYSKVSYLKFDFEKNKLEGKIDIPTEAYQKAKEINEVLKNITHDRNKLLTIFYKELKL